MPAMLMTDCLLLSLTDITADDSKQKQIVWQWDFFQPLLSQAQAAGALNGLMRILNGGRGDQWGLVRGSAGDRFRGSDLL